MQLAALVPAIAFALVASAAETTATRLKSDLPVSADPAAAAWKGVPAVDAAVDPFGKPAPNAFKFRVAWSDRSLFFLFECPYDELNLKPDPVTNAETNKLWEWDVAEVFIGAEFGKIHRYREYQVSPQAEWVDLDIDRKSMDAGNAVKWDSGFQVAARIDKSKKVWYGAMKIPLAGIQSAPAKPGDKMRMNIYRLAGKAPSRQSIMWTETGNRSHHTPEKFGILVLGK
jgi:hypothetical protein